MFQIAYGTLKLSFGSLENLTPDELSWLLENHKEEQKAHYEWIAYAFRAGYVSAHNGKKIKLFEEKEVNKVNRITKEEKESQLAYLSGKFNKE